MSVAASASRSRGPWNLDRRRTRVRPEGVAAWCDDLARRSRSGTSLHAALCGSVAGDPVVQVATEPIRRALRRGMTVQDALTTVVDRSLPTSGAEHLALAYSVIGVVASVGGSPAPPLERVAAALRLRAVDREDRATQAAQARMSAHVLSIVPFVMLAVLSIVDPDVRAAVVRPAGLTCVVLGLVLNAAGWLWMRRVVEVRR